LARVSLLYRFESARAREREHWNPPMTALDPTPVLSLRIHVFDNESAPVNLKMTLGPFEGCALTPAASHDDANFLDDIRLE
jgi:hypothetical protein